MISLMSTSLNVVSMAVSCFTATNLSATRFRSMVIFSLRSVRLPFFVAPAAPAATGSKTSAFVILPPFPVGVICDELNPFSRIIFSAATDGIPFV